MEVDERECERGSSFHMRGGGSTSTASGLTDFWELNVPIQPWKWCWKTSWETKPERFLRAAAASAYLMISFRMALDSEDVLWSSEAESEKRLEHFVQLSGIHRWRVGSIQGAWRRHKWPCHFSLELEQFLHSLLEPLESERDREDISREDGDREGGKKLWGDSTPASGVAGT